MALTTILSGLGPAARLSAQSAADGLRLGDGYGRTTVPVRRAQAGILIAQMATSVVLLVCTALLGRTFVQLRSEPLGFQSEDITVATVELPATPFGSSVDRNVFYDQVAADLLTQPGVRGVAASTMPPLVTAAPRISAHDVTAGYFATLGIPLVAGRDFDRRDGPRGTSATRTLVNPTGLRK